MHENICDAGVALLDRPLYAMRDLVERHTEGRFLGIYGEPRVNVLLLNLRIREMSAR